MRRSGNSAESEQREQRFLAYLADARTSDEEKGIIALVLLGHAGFYLVLATTELAWAALTAARVLRRRDDGLPTAVRAGVHTPTLAMFVAANVGCVVLRRAILARLDRRIGFRPSRP